MNWTSGLEKVLLEYKCKCSAFKWMNNEATRLFRQRNTILGIVNISVVSFTAINQSINGAIDSNNDSTGWRVISMVIPYLAALTSSFQIFLKYAEKSKEFEKCSIKYNALYNSVQRELILDPENRQDAVLYFKWFVKEYDNLYTSTVNIPSGIVKLYEDKFGTITENINTEEPKGIITPAHTKITINATSNTGSSSTPSEERVITSSLTDEKVIIPQLKLSPYQLYEAERYEVNSLM